MRPAAGGTACVQRPTCAARAGPHSSRPAEANLHLQGVIYSLRLHDSGRTMTATRLG